MKRRTRFLTATSALLLAAAASVEAQTFVWTGSGSDDYWTTGGNWLGGTPPPLSPISQNQITFNGSSTLGPVLVDSDWSVGGVTFSSGSPSLEVSTDNASALSIWAGIVNSSSVNQTVSAPLILNASPYSSNTNFDTSGSGSHLHITGPVNVNGARSRLFGANGALSTINFSGNISGNGTIWSGYHNSRGYFTGANTFAGNLETQQGNLAITGNIGSFANSAEYSVGGFGLLEVGDAISTSANPNRLNDSGILRLNARGEMRLIGTDNAATTSEVVGQISSLPGAGTIRLEPANDARQVELVSASALDRHTGSVLFVTGQNLGAAPGPNTTRLLFDTAPELVGGGGADGTTTIDIVPFVIASGNLTSESSTRGFATYGANGLRPLDLATEYLSSLAGATASDNVRLSANATLASPADVNSLILGSSRTLNLGGNSLDVQSGALYIEHMGAVSNGTMDFGSREGIITASQSTISASLGGSGGLTLALDSGASTISGNNTYSGVTHLLGAVDVRSSSAFGASGVGNHTVLTASNARLYLNTGISLAEDLVIMRELAGDSFTPLHSQSGDNVVSGNLSVIGTTNSSSLYIYTNAGSALTFQGDIVLEAGASSASLNLRPATNSRITISGQITDAASDDFIFLASNTTNEGTIELQSANNYRGNTQISSGATLLVSNLSGSATGHANVSLSNSSRLAGSGFIDPSTGNHVYITNSASLAPGDPDVAGGIGTLTVGSSSSENDVWFSSGSSLFVDVGATADLLNIFGGLVTSGTADIFVNVDDAGGASPGIYTIVDYTTSFTGDFGLFELNPLPMGWSGSLVHNTVAKSVEFHLSAIPEPSTVGLMLLGLGALLARRRRKG